MNADFVALLRPYLAYAPEDGIEPDARLRDLGLDSMRAIELLFAIEDAYDLVIPDEWLTESTFETPGSLWSVVERLRDGSCNGGPA